MPTLSEIAYREGVRALEGQASDLENIRTHLSIVLTAGGVAIAFLAAQHPGHGDAFVVAAAAFGIIAAMTVVGYWPVEFAWDFSAYSLVTNYVDVGLDDDEGMRELAVHAGDDYETNRAQAESAPSCPTGRAGSLCGRSRCAVVSPGIGVNQVAKNLQKPPATPRPSTSTPNPSNFEKKGGFGGGAPRPRRPRSS
jgi:hypothetical protein